MKIYIKRGIFVDSLIKKYGNNIRISPGIKPMVTLKLDNNSESNILKEVKDFLV